MSDKATREVLLDYAAELGDTEAERLLRKRESDGLVEALFDFSIALAREGYKQSPIVLRVENYLFWRFFEKCERFIVAKDPVRPLRRAYGPLAPRSLTQVAQMQEEVSVRTHEDLNSFILYAPGGAFRIEKDLP